MYTTHRRGRPINEPVWLVRDVHALGGRQEGVGTSNIPQDAAAIPGTRAIETGYRMWHVPIDDLVWNALCSEATTNGALVCAAQAQFGVYGVSKTNGYPKRMLAGTKSTALDLATAFDTTLGKFVFTWASIKRVSRKMLRDAGYMTDRVAVVGQWQLSYLGSGEGSRAQRASVARAIAYGDSLDYQRLDGKWTGSAPTFGTMVGESSDIDVNGNWDPVSGSVTNEEISQYDWALGIV